VTTTTHTDSKPDVHEMVVVHRAFRREAPALAEYVRRTPAGDTGRARVVADHLRLCLAGLEMHHTGEDTVLWPLLLERAAPSTGLVETMQAQHHAIDEGIELVLPAVEAWEAAPDPDSGERVAALLEQMTAALVEHLDLEEREILPIAARHVSAQEWDRMREHGKDSMTPAQLPIMFGLVLEEADAEERARMLAGLPLPVRLLLRTVGAWQFKRYVRRLRSA
jgi:hemerythrin-like domain-containing protein